MKIKIKFLIPGYLLLNNKVMVQRKAIEKDNVNLTCFLIIYYEKGFYGEEGLFINSGLASKNYLEK